MSQSLSSLREIVTQNLREFLPDFVLSLEQADIESYIINGYVSRRFRLEGRFPATTYTKIMRTESETHAKSLLDGCIPERSEDAIYRGDAVKFIVKSSGEAFSRGTKICLTDLPNDAELVFVYSKPKPWSVWHLWQDQYYGVTHEEGEFHEKVSVPDSTQTQSHGGYEHLFTAGERNQDYWMAIFQKAIHRRSRFGYSMDTVTTMTVLALIHIIYHDLNAAEEVLENAWKLSTELSKPSNLVLERMNTLGSIFEEYDRYEEALAVYRRVLDRSNFEIGTSGSLILSTRLSIIFVLNKQGRYREAAAMSEQQLDLTKQVLGPEHPNTLNTINLLGNLYRDQGELKGAEQLLEQALSNYERVLGSDHPSIIDALNTLGTLYTDQGKLTEAEVALKRVLTSCEAILDLDHIRTLDAANNLALVYNAQGRLVEAEQLLLRAETGYEKVLGSNHLITLDAVNNLGLVYQAQGKLDQAEQSYRSAFRRREKVLGDEHPLTLTSKNNLAEVLKQLGHHVEAEQLHRTVLEAYRKTLGDDHPATLASKNNLSALLNEKEQYTLTQLRQPPRTGKQDAPSKGDLSIVTDQRDATIPIAPNASTSTALTIRDFKILLICSPSIEIVVAEALLDEIYDDSALFGKFDSLHHYVLGRMHRHNIVIASQPKGIYVNTSVDSLVKDALRKFPAIRIGLLLSIGGGIPNNTKNYDIRLGDVVVSQPDDKWSGLIQYDIRNHGDLFKLESSQFYIPRTLLTALEAVKLQHQKSRSRVPTYLSEMIRYNRRLRDYSFPAREPDVLECSHGDSTKKSCKACVAGKVRRAPRKNQDPEVHYGLIASGNQLIRDAHFRDEFGKQSNALCFEMEAAGLANKLPGLVICGICDYADAFKNTHWQKYAAAAAAAFAKELLYHVPDTEEFDEEPSSMPNPVRAEIFNSHIKKRPG